MIALLLLLLPFASAQTPAPTIPTPYPTQTPAPESLCTYVAADEGPFPLDCLQQQFIAAGCSMRGQSYPTNTRLSGNDKAWYNQQVWGDVLTELATIQTT